MAGREIKFFQTGSFAVGGRLLDPDQRSVQSDALRSNAITSGSGNQRNGQRAAVP